MRLILGGLNKVRLGQVGRGHGIAVTRPCLNGGFGKDVIALNRIFLDNRLLGLFATRHGLVTRQHETFHGFIDCELDANHGHHRDQTGWQAPVKGRQAFFPKDAHGTVNNPLVGDGSSHDGRPGLRHQTRLDGIHGNHNTHRRGTGHTAHDGIFEIRGRSMAPPAPYLFQLLKERPREGVGRNLAHQAGPPALVKGRHAAVGVQALCGRRQMGIIPRHDIIRDHHLRRRHGRTRNGRQGTRQEIQAGRQGVLPFLQPGRLLDQDAHALADQFQDGKVDGPVGDGQQEIRAGAPCQASKGRGLEQLGHERTRRSPVTLQNRLHGIGRVHGGLGNRPTNGTANHVFPKDQGAGCRLFEGGRTAHAAAQVFHNVVSLMRRSRCGRSKGYGRLSPHQSTTGLRFEVFQFRFGDTGVGRRWPREGVGDGTAAPEIGGRPGVAVRRLHDRVILRVAAAADGRDTLRR
jgi:hypothetical protein